MKTALQRLCPEQVHCRTRRPVAEVLAALEATGFPSTLVSVRDTNASLVSDHWADAEDTDFDLADTLGLVDAPGETQGVQGHFNVVHDREIRSWLSLGVFETLMQAICRSKNEPKRPRSRGDRGL